MAQKGCITRLQKEYKGLLREPVPHIQAHPLPANLLEWHYVLEGAKGTDFEGGVYHGKLTFPANYPFKPPSISIFTPNGRFAVNTKLCLSITDFHPESWNPMWSVGTILTGLLSFMYDSQPTTGSISSSKADKQRYAAESLAFNVRNATFRKLFPQWVEEHARRAAAAPAAAQQQRQQAASAGAGAGAPPQPQQQQAAPGGGAQQPQQQQPQQRHAHAAGGGRQAAGAGAAAAAGGGDGGGGGHNPHQPSSLFAVALAVIVLAIAAVPLLSTNSGFGSFGKEALSRLRG